MMEEKYWIDDVVETINEHLKKFSKQNRDNIALAEARHKVDIFRYNAKSNGAEDYMALADNET
jgi:chromosome partitioning protein